MSWPNAWLAASSAALVLALAGCGGGDGGDPEGPLMEPTTATALADRSEAVADLIDAGNQCDAAHEADLLDGEAQKAVDEGRVPAALVDELLARTRELVDKVNCDEELPPPPPPPPPPAPRPPPPPDGDD